jgi:hypothetical protein
VPGGVSSRGPACRSHIGCPRWSCGSHLACAGRASLDVEAMRALKRRLSDIVYRTMLGDALRPAQPGATTAAGTGPGGHSGAATNSSAVDSNPGIDPSEKSLPGPATDQPTTPLPTAS